MISTTKLLLNNYTRVWFLDPMEYHPIYQSSVAISRIMVDSGIARLLLKSQIKIIDETHLVSALRDFTDGTTIEIVYGECGDPTVYRGGFVIAHFENCEIRRSWVSKPGALSQEDSGVILKWLDIRSDKWAMEF